MPDLRPILLVEDNPRDLELTLAALKRSQLANEIIVTRDGEEALDYIFARGRFEGRNTGDPAVVLLDLKLPKIDGHEVIQKVKESEDARHIPIVVLTSSREERDLVESYSKGVNSFVVKPVDFQAFFDAIQDIGMFWAVINEPHPGKRSGQR